MKLIFIMDDNEYTLDHIDPSNFSLYDIFKYLNSCIRLNAKLENRIGNQNMLLHIPYIDKDNITGSFIINTHHVDPFNRYQLSLENVMRYLTSLTIPDVVKINVTFDISKTQHHNDRLLNQISRGRTLSDSKSIRIYLDNLHHIYDAEYIYNLYFTSDCLPHLKILLTASFDESRLPEIKHPLCDKKLSHWDEYLVGTPQAVAKKCVENHVDLIDFYYAAKLNITHNYDRIIHLNIKRYVNANLKKLAKILLYPQVPDELKKSICSMFRQCIFPIVKHSIEKLDVDFYSHLTESGEFLATTSAKNCVVQWLARSSKADFITVLGPIIKFYNDPAIHRLLIAELDRERREWFFELSPFEDTRPIPWFNFNNSNYQSLKLFPIPNLAYKLNHFHSPIISNTPLLSSLHDRLLKSVMAADKLLANFILEEARKADPQNYWHLALTNADGFETHANRKWLISPLEFATWAGDIYLVIMIIESLPAETAILKHALLQIKSIIHRKSQLEHGVFMAPFYSLLYKYADHHQSYDPHCSRPWSQSKRHDQLQILGEHQRQLPMYGLQVICNPLDDPNSFALHTEPKRECVLGDRNTLDIADLGAPWVLTRHQDGSTTAMLESHTTDFNKRDGRHWYSHMHDLIKQLCAMRAKDFEMEITCLENQIKQLEEPALTCNLGVAL